MLLVRKINLDRWAEPQEGFGPHEVPAELLRAEFNAKGNALSLWTAAGEKEIDEAALAIVGGFQRVETFDLAWFTREELDAAQVQLQPSDGHTKVQDLVKRHVDAAHLDGFRLAAVARLVAVAIAENRARRITKDDAADLLLAAVDVSRLNTTNLAKEVRLEIEMARQRRGQ